MNYDLIDLENFGKAASKAYLEHKIPLNDSVSKLAEVNNLNSEQVKLVVEEANNSTHLSLLPAAEDKYLEFDVADYNKVASTVFDNEPQVDKLADYRLSPLAKKEDFSNENEEVTLVTSHHQMGGNPDNMTNAEITKFADTYNGKMRHYKNALGEHQAEFDKFSEKYYNGIKQAVMGGEKLGHIKQAAIMTQEDSTSISALDTFFDEVKERLKSAGVSVYPFVADLNLDTEDVYLGIPNKEHDLIKLSEDFCDRVLSYKDALEKEGSIAAGVTLLAGGAALGTAGTSAVMAIAKKQADMKKAIELSNPLLRRNRLNDIGHNAATRRY